MAERRGGPHHHLQRLDHRGFAGWVVRISRGGRPVCSRYVSDRRHGGREGSLREALRQRDKLLRMLPPPVLAKLRDSRNVGGVVGVHEVRRRRRDRRGMLSYYVATWVWPPRSRHQVQRCFSVRKYGKRMARELALEARRAALARIADEERRRLLDLLSRER